jgi:hypothetical protein
LQIKINNKKVWKKWKSVKSVSRQQMVWCISPQIRTSNCYLTIFWLSLKSHDLLKHSSCSLFKSGLWIRIDFNSDPAFLLNPDPVSPILSWAHSSKLLNPHLIWIRIQNPEINGNVIFYPLL